MQDYCSQYQERDGEEDRTPGGKTRVKDMTSVWLKKEDVLDRIKWKNDIHNHAATLDGGTSPEENKKKQDHCGHWEVQSNAQRFV